MAPQGKGTNQNANRPKQEPPNVANGQRPVDSPPQKKPGATERGVQKENTPKEQDNPPTPMETTPNVENGQHSVDGSPNEVSIFDSWRALRERKGVKGQQSKIKVRKFKQFREISPNIDS